MENSDDKTHYGAYDLDHRILAVRLDHLWV